MKGVCRHSELLWDEELQATGCTDDGTDPHPPAPLCPTPAESDKGTTVLQLRFQNTADVMKVPSSPL